MSLEWTTKSAKKPIIAAPRPVAPIALKNSGNALPMYIPSINVDEDCDSLYDLEAESELQQIFGGSKATPGLNLWESADDIRATDDYDDITSSYPFLALENPGDSPLEFPRLGLSPLSFKPEADYSTLPTRSRNPVTLNTPFIPKDHFEFPAVMTQSLKLALVGMEYQTQKRSRSYSEPIPFYVE